ncbi:isochorismatase family protein [Xylariaceae sp. FL0255]|nr:isochorismatase family protein [Xylariaceae sp. FL0255]
MEKTALILMDIQCGIVALIEDQMDTGPWLSKMTSTLESARKAGIPVIQVTTSFRPNYADANPRNQLTSKVKALGKYKDDDDMVKLHPAIEADAKKDIHVKKRRVSALHGNDMEIVLRSLGVEHIVVAGLATSGCVLSTVRQAADMDYKITVLADLCADRLPHVHEMLINNVLSQQATISNAADWVASFEK